MTTAPVATNCQKDGTFINVKPFCIAPRVKAPMSEPRRVALAAKQTRATNHSRANRLQLEPVTANGFGGANSADEDETRNARKQTRDGNKHRSLRGRC